MKRDRPDQPIEERELVELNRELFALFQDLFGAVTGSTPEEFAPTSEDFSGAVRKVAGKLSEGGREAFGLRVQGARSALVAFYKTSGPKMFSGAKQLPGLKLVQGGMQAFGASSLASARSMALYADTLLIPDSVSRWFERESSEEAFVFPRMLEDLYHILQLRPLVDAKLPYPAIVLFPSLERTLEENSPTTRDGQSRLMLEFFSHHLDEKFDATEEIWDFADRYEEEFLSRVVDRRLFVPLGGDGSEDLNKSIASVREDYARWRGAEYAALLEHASDSQIVMTLISERLGPQYHLAENADILRASPLMSLPVHWHYSELLQDARTSTMRQEGSLSDDSARLVRGLSAPNHHWLGNVPVEQLVDLRIRGENETFRRSLEERVEEFASVDASNVDMVARQVGRGLEMLLVDHDNDVRKLEEQYKKKYTGQCMASWITLCAGLSPWIPAVLPAAAVAITARYLIAKNEETGERRSLSRTLTGVLAASARIEK